MGWLGGLPKIAPHTTPVNYYISVRIPGESSAILSATSYSNALVRFSHVSQWFPFAPLCHQTILTQIGMVSRPSHSVVACLGIIFTRIAMVFAAFASCGQLLEHFLHILQWFLDACAPGDMPWDMFWHVLQWFLCVCAPHIHAIDQFSHILKWFLGVCVSWRDALVHFSYIL